MKNFIQHHRRASLLVGIIVILLFALGVNYGGRAILNKPIAKQHAPAINPAYPRAIHVVVSYNPPGSLIGVNSVFATNAGDDGHGNAIQSFQLQDGDNLISWLAPGFQPLHCHIHFPLHQADDCHMAVGGAFDKTHEIFNDAVFQPSPDDLTPTARAQFDTEFASYVQQVEAIAVNIPAHTAYATYDQESTTTAQSATVITEHLQLSPTICSRIICPADVSISMSDNRWMLENFFTQTVIANGQPFGTPFRRQPMISLQYQNGAWQFNPSVQEFAQEAWDSESCGPIYTILHQLYGPSLTSMPSNVFADSTDTTVEQGICAVDANGGHFIARYGVLYAGNTVAHQLAPALPTLP